MPLRIAGALAALAAATLLAAAPAQAAGKTAAACAIQLTTTISPGFSTVPSSGTQTSNGQTGTIACVGKLAGRRITGPGSVGFDSTYTGGTCASETASGTVRATIPTAAGDQHLVGALTVQRTASIVRAQVQFHGIRYSGTGTAIPLQGNCLVTPLRRALIVLTGTVSRTKTSPVTEATFRGPHAAKIEGEAHARECSIGERQRNADCGVRPTLD